MTRQVSRRHFFLLFSLWSPLAVKGCLVDIVVAVNAVPFFELLCWAFVLQPVPKRFPAPSSSRAILTTSGGNGTHQHHQLGAARTVHSLLASSARASRRRAWLQWRKTVAETTAAKALHGARRRSLRRCLRSRLLRDTRAAWEVLQSRVRRSRAVASATDRLNGVLLRSRRRALSRGLGVWRSESLAEAIAAGRRQGVRDSRHAAVRLLGSVAARVRRRRLENGWRALALCASDGRRAEAAAAARAEHAELLVTGAAQRSRRRALVAAWKAWRELVARRRLRGAVGAATSSLTERTASLARQVQLLRLGGAVRLVVSVAERSNRYVPVSGPRRTGLDGAEACFCLGKGWCGKVGSLPPRRF